MVEVVVVEMEVVGVVEVVGAISVLCLIKRSTVTESSYIEQWEPHNADSPV